MRHAGWQGRGIEELEQRHTIIPALWGLRPEGFCQLKASLSYVTMRACSTTKLRGHRCCQARWSEFDPGTHMGEGERPTAVGCPLTPHVHTHEISVIGYLKYTQLDPRPDLLRTLSWSLVDPSWHLCVGPSALQFPQARSVSTKKACLPNRP